MPARRIIQLSKATGGGFDDRYETVFWTDIPSAAQPAFKGPEKKSAFRGVSITELTALRTGQVFERVITTTYTSGTPVATVDADLQARWTAFQAEDDLASPWPAYGRYWNGTVWTAGGTPADILRAGEATQPTFFALAPVTGFAANRFHFVLFNNASYAKVRVLLLVAQPQLTVVTGVQPSAWTLRRRQAPTTPPGGGLVGVVSADSNDAIPSGITLHSIPTTAPAGGTLDDFLTLFPPGDEVKANTLDQPGYAAVSAFGGAPLYDASKFRPSVPLVLRTNETMELQQSATAGTGNTRIFCVFTVEDER